MTNPEIILKWPTNQPLKPALPVAGYTICPLPEGQDAWWIDIQHRAVPRYQPAGLTTWLTRYRQLALPNGILVAIEDSTQTAVATAGSLASPRDTLFSNAGEIGWVATIPAHRRRGLSTWLCTVATARLLESNFDTIFLTTGPDMPAAIRVYLQIGYLPYLLDEAHRNYWVTICREINWPIEPELWLHA